MVVRYKTAIGTMLRQCLDFVLPPHCLISGEPVEQQSTLDPAYWRQLNFIDAPFCDCCGRPFSHQVEGKTLCRDCIHDRPSYNQARSVLIYDQHSKALILKFKYGDRLEVAPLLATWLQTKGHVFFDKSDFLMPVPLHPWRRIRRKFNQSAVIARHLSPKIDIPVVDGVLKRTRHTPTQQGDKKTRSKNVAQAFTVNEKDRSQIIDKSILLIDDVYTTGSTVKECATALLKHGAKEVNVLTIARVRYVK